MSMSMSFDYTERPITPSPTPLTPSPTLSASPTISASPTDFGSTLPPTGIFDEISEGAIAASCGGQDQGDVNILLDVDTSGPFSDVVALEEALTEALREDFPLCDDIVTRRGRRGLIERKLAEDFYLRLVIVSIATDGSK